MKLLKIRLKSKQEKDKLYDKNKRKRTVVDSWKDDFAWLDVKDEALFCTYCKSFPTIAGNTSFIKGSTSLHRSILLSHDTSRNHIAAKTYYLQRLNADPNKTKKVKMSHNVLKSLVLLLIPLQSSQMKKSR
jgi:hypothetical protein